MNTDRKTYPSWIKYFLAITATLGLIKALITFLTNITLYETKFAVTTFVGSILLFVSVILIINKKFHGYVMYVILLLCEYPLSLYFFGSVNERVYYAIFVRLILMSLLIFVPFRHRRSLFHAMMPLVNPLKKLYRIHSRKKSITDPISADINKMSDLITAPNSKEKSIIRNIRNIKLNPLIAKIAKSALCVICILGICMGIFYGLSYFFREDNHGGYLLDVNNLIHTNTNCPFIEQSSELVLSNVLYKQAISPQNIVLPQHGMHFCGKCFTVSEITQIQDSLKVYTHNFWGTLDSDSLTLLVKDINWFFNHFENKYQWENSMGCLIYFKNYENALQFYIHNCNDWNLGTPKEFLSLLSPIFYQSPADIEIEHLTRRKYVYEILKSNNYEMEEFNEYLNHVSEPIRRERLYNTIVMDKGFNDTSIPLESYSDFQDWMGF